ncbi:MAG TPA: efflux RND transporter permease subunit, partial [Myxococcaceae bacterium]|nr:efflux RND transporter permease subunit [Myxococcaceae bacterium]
MPDEQKLGIAGRMARTFLRSKLTPLVVLASILLGVFAVLLTPREEEPQIVVPMVDVLIPFPGASATEVESQLTTPIERRLWGIPGVEYLYSTSRTGAAFITVRFRVNEPLEPSIVKVRQELEAHPELLPPAAQRPVVRLLTIDDVPFLTLTLHGELPAGELRKLGEEVAREIAAVPDTAQVRVLGAARRVVRVEPDPERLRSVGVSLAELQAALQSSDAQLPAGALVNRGQRTELEATGFFRSSEELARVVVRESADRPIYVRDVATVTDGPEPEPAIILVSHKGEAGFEQAVSIAVAKRSGVNATVLARRVLDKVRALRGGLIPERIRIDVTRNYGETANDKSNELIEHLLIATLSVIVLISLAMGWRSGLVVAIAVPVTLALTLLLTFLFGYTLNRVTLFALIFSIGILVDDAIVVVENIHRHLHLPGPPRSFARTVLDAVDEVGNPTVLATFAVIAAILPMAFVRGLMGPYMRPIPVGASAAMLFSLAIAFIVSPWAALRIFRREANLPQTDASGLHPADPENVSPEPGRDFPETRLSRLYRRGMSMLLRSSRARWAFLALVVLLLSGAMALVATGAVKVKMLPFDNKSEFQVQLDLPAGTAREESLALAQKMARLLLVEPEVNAVQVHSGVAAPFTFVGMVRHAFLREAPEQVDIQVQLLPKGERKAQSHPIATRIRPRLEALASHADARLKLVEIPPGPPVLDTLLAEVYGPTAAQRDAYARDVLQAFHSTPGVVDIDSSLNPTASRLSLAVDREKAVLHGVAPAAVVQAISSASQGLQLGTLHIDRGAAQVPILLQLAVAHRSLPDLLQLTVPGTRGAVPLSELVELRSNKADADISHKNLIPVAYVFGDVAGNIESPVYALLALNK